MRHFVGRYFGSTVTHVSNIPFDEAYKKIESTLYLRLRRLPNDPREDWEVHIERDGYGMAHFTVIGYAELTRNNWWKGHGSDGTLKAIDDHRTQISLTKTTDPGALLFATIYLALGFMMLLLAQADGGPVFFVLLWFSAAVIYLLILLRWPFEPLIKVLSEFLELEDAPYGMDSVRKRKQSEAERDDHWNDTPLLK